MRNAILADPAYFEFVAVSVVEREVIKNATDSNLETP
jgi:hypothetical protein